MKPIKTKENTMLRAHTDRLFLLNVQKDAIWERLAEIRKEQGEIWKAIKERLIKEKIIKDDQAILAINHETKEIKITE